MGSISYFLVGLLLFLISTASRDENRAYEQAQFDDHFYPIRRA